MVYALIVQPEAQAEAEEIYDHLERQLPGLGDRFADALEKCYRYIHRLPLGFQIRRGRYRHVLLDGFHYRVVYMVDGELIYVYQVRHTSRKPDDAFGP